MISDLFGPTKEASGAGLAARSVITRVAVTADAAAILADLASSSEIVGRNGQGTSTNETVSRCTYGRVSIIALLAKLAMIACRAIFAVLEHSFIK